MSFRAITEFMLHIEHFRNIDLYQQGMYFIKYQIFHLNNNDRFYAHPYHHENGSESNLEGGL